MLNKSCSKIDHCGTSKSKSVQELKGSPNSLYIYIYIYSLIAQSVGAPERNSVVAGSNPTRTNFL